MRRGGRFAARSDAERSRSRLMKLLLDMNLSPASCGALAHDGFEASHGSSMGERSSMTACSASLRSRLLGQICNVLDKHPEIHRAFFENETRPSLCARSA